MEEQSQSKKPLKQRQGSTKIDPSFKSKRYRDKLRTEVKALESLIPIDRPALHRKLDSQTVYRLVIAFLRLKNYFKSVRLQDAAQINCDSDQTARSSDPTSATQCLSNENKLWKEININELLEGFILMLSVDGTIMYVSENVLQFNGFNQVDLIHRCVYGIIHPDDQLEVRNILEENGLYSYGVHNHQMGLHGMREKPHSDLHQDESSAVSFFCRMKCFVGSTAGYMKLHCSGKIQTAPSIPRSTKTSDRIAILFCQPFIYNGNDVMNDSKDNVFWSKHDLDLTFKETENKITDILGYDEKELEDTSLYQLVHVEDLHTLVMAHKAKVSDVQSFFVRLKHKDGSWTWLHTKGKIISKNSKKFSVVFTHCPLRDENSAFLQQEILVRRKHSLTDLMLLSSWRNRTRDHVIDEFVLDRNGASRRQVSSNVCTSYNLTRPRLGIADQYKCKRSNYPRDYCDSPNEEVSAILNPMTFVPMPCPSTWHVTSDRHSPVVPSSHVAHKLCLKEKQLQFAQLKRPRQPGHREEKHEAFSILDQCNPTQTYTSNITNTPQHSIQAIGQRRGRDTNSDLYQQSLYLYNVGPGGQSNGLHPFHRNQLLDDKYHTLYHPTELYNYPPSPPPSPMRNVTHSQSNMIFHDSGSPALKYLQPLHSEPEEKCCTTTRETNFLTNQPNVYPTSDCNCHTDVNYPHNYHSHANFKFSMILNTPRSAIDQLSNVNRNSAYGAHRITNSSAPINHRYQTEAMLPTNQMKYEPGINQSCSSDTDHVVVNSSTDCVHYDVEASIHMKIVETEGRTSQSCPEVEIPAFDSFMDYLTDEKIY